MPNLFSAAFIFAKTRLSAAFTVEAALLMALILPVLLSLIYMGFLDHDRGVLNQSLTLTTSSMRLPPWLTTVLRIKPVRKNCVPSQKKSERMPFLCPAAWSLLFHSAKILFRFPTQEA